jgi:hypothetical protein
MKRLLFPFVTFLVVVLLGAVTLELIAIAVLYMTEGRYISARTRFASRTNTFAQDLSAGRDCNYLDTLFPHPYLAFVHHGNSPCGLPYVNNIGLFGPNFPSTHQEDRWVILVTGGSVANQFTQPVQGGPPYLERILNEHYVSPTGKPFLVLNGADGAWKQPQQAFLFLLFADAVDAVITLDGFNEHYMLESGYRFEYPANNFHTVNPLVTRSFGDVVSRWIMGHVQAAAARNAILSRSHAVYSIIAATEDFLAKRADSRPKPRTTVETLFSLPPEWSSEQRKTWAMGQYQKYIRAMSAVARDYDVREAHFIQPAPAIGKRLTDPERAVVGDLGYRAVYQEMTDSLLTLNARGVHVGSLLRIFESEQRSLYADPIHLQRSADGTSFGYEVMAQRIAMEISALWGLTARDTRAATRTNGPT